MDGHGSSYVAEICQKKLDTLLPDSLAPDADVEKLLEYAVMALVSETNMIPGQGSTLSIAYILEARKEVAIAILGDSPVIVIDEAGKVHVSPEHNVRSNPKELRAAQARGAHYDGRYISAYPDGPGLQMSRALGDAELGTILSSEPEIYTVKNPKWVIVGSDGLVDPGHRNSQRHVEEIVRMCKFGHTAIDLIREAKARDVEDNATALVWQIRENLGRKRKVGRRPKPRMTA